jgi:hypothetical protein
MKSFWADWKAAGSQPITRGCIRTGPRKDAPGAAPETPRAKSVRTGPKVVLTPEDIEFGLKTGMLKP